MKTIKNFFRSTWNIVRNNYFLFCSKKVIEVDYTTDSNINNHIFYQMFNNDFKRKLKDLRKSHKISSITVSFKIKVK